MIERCQTEPKPAREGRKETPRWISNWFSTDGGRPSESLIQKLFEKLSQYCSRSSSRAKPTLFLGVHICASCSTTISLLLTKHAFRILSLRALLLYALEHWSFKFIFVSQDEKLRWIWYPTNFLIKRKTNSSYSFQWFGALSWGGGRKLTWYGKPGQDASRGFPPIFLLWRIMPQSSRICLCQTGPRRRLFEILKWPQKCIWLCRLVCFVREKGSEIRVGLLKKGPFAFLDDGSLLGKCLLHPSWKQHRPSN